jgi:hypothetical protein
MITADTPFALEDDQYHKLSDDPFETETNWWSLNIPERRIGAWVHAAYHPNTQSVTTRLFVWDDQGADPARLAYYSNTGEVPMPPNPDLRDITFPSGYSLKMLKPAMDYQVTFSDPARNFSIAFEHRSVHPPHRFTPGEAPALHNPHFDQLGHITGELKLHGEKIAIDCYSVRDRTWGPRGGRHSQSQKPEYAEQRLYKVTHPGGPKWREIERQRGRGRLQYIFGHAGARTGFLSFVRPQDGDARGWSPLNMGWLLKDGRFVRLDKTQSRMRNYRDPKTGWSGHMDVYAVDLEGRTMEAEGFAVSHMCERGAGSNALMRWEFEGQTGWGEDQDGWQVDHFAQMLEALRATR